MQCWRVQIRTKCLCCSATQIIWLNIIGQKFVAILHLSIIGTTFVLLKQQIGFTEFRVFCTKPYHGRVQHALFNNTLNQGRKLFNYVVHDGERPNNICDKVKFLPDDTSMLAKNYPCSEVSPRVHGPTNHRLYKAILGKISLSLVTLETARCDCDDYFHATNERSGTWLYYVRWKSGSKRQNNVHLTFITSK